MMRRFTLLAALAVCLLSCGPGNKTTNTTNDSKKIFRLNLTGGLTSLDPVFADQRTNIWATTQLYNGLFTFGEDLHVHPELAENYKISEDGLTYTFTIKKNVYFHDDQAFKNGRGREVIADDFVYSFKRLMDPRTAAKGSWIFADKVKQSADKKLADDWIEKIDDYSFKITLNRRFPAFLQILSMPFTFVVAKEAVEKYNKDFRKHPVGTGPFMLKTWNEKDRLILVKNTKYWKRDVKDQPLPYLDAVDVSFIEDKNQAFLSFEKGSLHFLTSISETSRNKILNKDGSIKDDFSSKFVVEKKPYMLTEYIGILMEGTDEKANPLLNKKVRKALSYAINRKNLISFIRNGLGTPGSHGFIPDALSSFDSTQIQGYKVDIKKAQELLKDAGYPQGKGFPEITLSTYTTDKEIAGFLQKQWEDNLGIKVKIESNQFATHKDMVDNAKVKFFRGSWIGDYPDAENFLSLFYSKNFSPDGPNKTHFADETYDKLFEEAHETDNTFTRYSDYNKMDQIIMDNAPVIVLFYDEVLNLKQKNVTGLKTNTMNTLVLEKVDLKSGNNASANADDKKEEKKEESSK
ncbi:ABC transporter substrate-binding protein [uncultured Microscilla sp.]|uniref:ABC transporter substrate-binding protein n=1 Tax=uncultured Microscilla sp. TaxID=432653 RepID=UPI00262C6BC6|nr:ABC transporter substrate-binding protein [uncultured Microscilla sp.]